VDVTATSPTIAWGAGGIVSTVGDVDTFTRALMGGHLVPRSLLGQMEAATPGSLAGLQALNIGGTYGVGLIHFDWSYACGAWGHAGDIPELSTRAGAGAAGGKRPRIVRHSSPPAANSRIGDA